MNKDELNNRYFDWMYELVRNEKYYRRQSHRKLLAHLHLLEFTYTIGMDGNRAADGVDLRYRFGYERNYNNNLIATELDNQQCSVLEMMVALSLRCESIMDDPDAGNRTSLWFWNMIDNLDLEKMDDDHFDRIYVEDVISKLLNHKYERNGTGGLFVIKECTRDLRNVEIWYQMCWYLDNFL